MRLLIILNFIFIFAVICAWQTRGSEECAPATVTELIKDHIFYLASDELEGRLAGTPGCEMAAEYITRYFESLGLVPADQDGDYFQEFEISTGISLGDQNFLQANTGTETFEFSVNEDFVPMHFSGNGEVSCDVVFAGYGITSDEHGWDDYAQIDAKGKIVVCMRGEPGMDDPDSPFNGDRPTEYSGIRWKTFNAQNHGALALIVVTGPNNISAGESDELIELDDSHAYGESVIPVIQITLEVMEALWSGMDAPLSMYQSEMDRNRMSFGAGLEGVTISLKVELIREYSTTWNVAALLPGSGSGFSGKTLVIGAHYDHLGWGIEGSLYEGDEPAIHNGADDNASGTAGVLELARLFSSLPCKPQRNILFICFSAEELGTLGSIAYMDNPIVTVEGTVAMINMDMIGRVKPSEEGEDICMVVGTGTALEWDEIVPDYTPDGEVRLLHYGNVTGGSDFVPFYLAGIPVLNFFSGIHEDYNLPTDDADRINYDGEASVIGAVFEIAHKLAFTDQELTFQETTETNTALMTDDPDTRTGDRAYLGTIPDFTYEGDGFRIEGVQPGSPAESAGLKGGDQIVRVGEFEVSGIYDFTYALEQYEPGDTAEVMVIRDSLEITLTVTFGSRD